MNFSYKYNPPPDEAMIRCPRCRHRAVWRRASTLIRHEDFPSYVPRLWPCARATDWEGQTLWTPGEPNPTWEGWIILLHDATTHTWEKPSSGYEPATDGTILCTSCAARFGHAIDWPGDAWYRFEFSFGVLWAWTRHHADALLEFIASERRQPAAHGPYFWFLRKVPAAFLRVGNRAEVMKQMKRRLLELDPTES